MKKTAGGASQLSSDVQEDKWRDRFGTSVELRFVKPEMPQENIIQTVWKTLNNINIYIFNII